MLICLASDVPIQSYPSVALFEAICSVETTSTPSFGLAFTIGAFTIANEDVPL